jgi:hypothetical protein
MVVQMPVRHAVRWARRKLQRTYSMDWTRWHITDDACVTLCGVHIGIALAGRFLPESDDEWQCVATCRRCRDAAQMPDSARENQHGQG